MTEKFFEAIRAGERETVECRLRLAPDLIHARDASGLSPVLVAMYHHHADVAELLADKAVALDIYEAAATGRTNHLIRILAKRPDLVNAYAGDGFQSLGLACFFGHLEAADYLIKAGARVNPPPPATRCRSRPCIRPRPAGTRASSNSCSNKARTPMPDSQGISRRSTLPPRTGIRT